VFHRSNGALFCRVYYTLDMLESVDAVDRSSVLLNWCRDIFKDVCRKYAVSEAHQPSSEATLKSCASGDSSSSDRKTMPDSVFWQLIDRVDRIALKQGDCKSAIAPLEEALKELDFQLIKSFNERLTRALWKLDKKSLYTRCNDPGSDGFLYNRCFIIGLGRKYYDTALKSPELIELDLNDWFEELLNVASIAWERRSERFRVEIPWSDDCSISYETGSNKKEWR
jgi:Protein of unknown function (DUF4240)